MLARGEGDGSTDRSAFCNEPGLAMVFDLVEEMELAGWTVSAQDGSVAVVPESIAAEVTLAPSGAKANGKFSGLMFSNSCPLATLIADEVVRDAAFCSSAALAASTSLRLSSISLRRAFSDCCHAILEHRMASDLPV